MTVIKPASIRADGARLHFLAHPVPFAWHPFSITPATYMQSAIVQKVTGSTVLTISNRALRNHSNRESDSVQSSGITAAYILPYALKTLRVLVSYICKREGQHKLIPQSWVEEATARQTSNGSSPTSDWDQDMVINLAFTTQYIPRRWCFGQMVIPNPMR